MEDHSTVNRLSYLNDFTNGVRWGITHKAKFEFLNRSPPGMRPVNEVKDAPCCKRCDHRIS
jgi:hypothetical protein